MNGCKMNFINSEPVLFSGHWNTSREQAMTTKNRVYLAGWNILPNFGEMQSMELRCMK